MGWFCPWEVFNVTFFAGRNRVKFIRDHVTFKLPYDFSYQMKNPLIKFEPSWTKLVQFNPIWSSLCQVEPNWSNLIQSDPIWSTLDSGINIGVRLLILGLFSSGYMLIKGGMFVNFFIFIFSNIVSVYEIHCWSFSHT